MLASRRRPRKKNKSIRKPLRSFHSNMKLTLLRRKLIMKRSLNLKTIWYLKNTPKKVKRSVHCSRMLAH